MTHTVVKPCGCRWEGSLDGALTRCLEHEAEFLLERGWDEYCVMSDGKPTKPHRGPMSQDQACQWVAETEAMGSFSPGMFYVARRHVSSWKRA